MRRRWFQQNLGRERWLEVRMVCFFSSFDEEDDVNHRSNFSADLEIDKGEPSDKSTDRTRGQKEGNMRVLYIR